MPLAAGLVVLLDGKQTSVFALGAGVRLHADGVITCHLHQPVFEVCQQQLVTLGLGQRGEGVQLAELGPGHRDHLGGGVELHGAGAERDHGVVQGQILGFETVDVAQHLGLGVVLVEHLVGQHGVGAQQILRDAVVSLGLGIQGRDIQAMALTEEQIKQLGHVIAGGGFRQGHADSTVQIGAQVDAQPFGLGDQLGFARGQHCEGVEPAVVFESQPLGGEPQRQDAGQAMDPGGDGLQPHRAVVDGVEARHVGQQYLGGTDVGVRLLAADMLLAGLHRHAQGTLATGILGDAYDAARHGALVGIAGGEEGSVRATVAHGHAEALGRAEHHVGPQFTRGFEQQQGEHVGTDAGQSLLGLDGGDQGAQIGHLTCGGRVLEHGTEHLLAHSITGGAHGHVETEVHRALLDHVDHLGVNVVGHEEEIGLGLGHALGQRHGFGGGGGFIEQGGARQIHAGQVQGELLEVEQRLETALGQLRLIRGVGGVPARVFQDVAQDDVGHVGVVIAHADVALGDLVLGRIALELGQGFHFGHGGADTERAQAADGGGDSLLNQIVQTLGAHGGEQGPHFFLTRAYVATDEIGFLLEFKQ
ncbi:hypothetical protein D3C86_946460 [compost metagenome]